MTITRSLLAYLDGLVGGPGCTLALARAVFGEDGIRLVPRWMIGGDAQLMRCPLRKQPIVLIADDVRGRRRLDLIGHELGEYALEQLEIVELAEMRANIIADLLVERCAFCRHDLSLGSLGSGSPGRSPSDAA